MRKLIKLTAAFLCLALLLTGCVFGIGEESGPNTVPPAENPSDNTASSDESGLQVHFIDVGQADAALILCDGEAMLIDGGNAEDSDLIYAYLEEHGVEHLDYIVCTHAHEDHVGGLSGALNYATVDVAWCPVTSYSSKAFENFVSYLNAQDVSITVPSPGDTFSLGDATGTVVGPVSPSDDPNNTSIVIRLEYGDTSFLFTGDAEAVEEQEILDAGYDISCTVLKVGHHGSDTSTSYPWLWAAAPQYAVISVGQNNSYGHPTEGTLSKLRDADVTVYRTDLQGHIICTSDGTNVSFTVQRNADADTLAGAGEGGNHTDAETEPGADASGESMDYVVNTSSGKFHIPSCSSVEDILEENRLDVTATRDELIEQGYTPCGRCKP